MMLGANHSVVALGGYNFAVWHKGDQVEIIRQGFAPPRDQARLKPLMEQAAREVTGCALRPSSIEGDSGVMRARMDCG
jgi:hypothetical protein